MGFKFNVFTGNLDFFEPDTSGDAPVVVFVYRPGGTQADNVYDNWTDLYAATLTVEGLKYIYVDESLGTTNVPAGTYDLSDVILQGMKVSGSNSVLRFLNDSTTVNNLTKIGDDISVLNAAATPVMTIAANAELKCGYNSLIGASGTAPLIQITTSSVLTLTLLNNASIPDLGYEAIEIDSGSRCDIYFVWGAGFTRLQADTLRGAGDAKLISVSSTSLYSTTHSNLSGTITEQLNNNADKIAYDETLIPSGLVSTNVQDAIDELAQNVIDTNHTFVFQPGGTAGDNVYTSFANLYTDLSSVSGHTTLVFDNTFSACTIPAGTYDFSQTEFTQIKDTAANQSQTVTIADTVTFSGFPRCISWIKLDSASTTNVYTLTSVRWSCILRNSAFLSVSGSAPMIEIAGLFAVFNFYIHDNSGFSNSADEVANINGTSNVLTLLFYSGGFIGVDTVSGDGTLQLQYFSTSASYSSTQTNHSGSIVTSLPSEAEVMNVQDIGAYFVATDVEGVLQEIGAAGGGGDDLGNHTATQDLAMAGFDIDNAGVVFLTEQAAANADVAGQGQIWVKNDVPNTLYFTNDAGTDVQLGVAADNLGNHTATTDLLMGTNNIKFSDNQGVIDANSNELMSFQTITSAVNYIDIWNAATLGSPSIRAKGDDTDVSLILYGQNSGKVITGSVFQTNARFLMTAGANVASADEITLGNNNFFDITGTTTINHINKTDWEKGAFVILKFNASVTVTHNAGSPTGTEADIYLAGAANFSATSGDTLTLVYDGSIFRETARTVI